jgi:hypothetical protein
MLVDQVAGQRIAAAVRQDAGLWVREDICGIDNLDF